jgi:hypothetical protein
MTFHRRPRVFLSYRHEERSGMFASGYNAKHVAWVEAFAHALATWNVDVIWDGRMRDLFRPHTKADPATVPFLAEVSTLCLMSAQAFMPIVTRGYLERVCEGGKAGVVTEEWRRAVEEAGAGRVEIIGVVREWPAPGYAAPPPELTAKNAWDYRFVAPVKDEVERLADKVHLLWDVERPPLELPFAKLISVYLQYCIHEHGLPWPGVETWPCNFVRPRVFLELMRAEQERAGPAVHESARQDELQAALSALGVPVKKMDTPYEPDADELSPEEERKMAAQAVAATRAATAAHLERTVKPFDFASAAPGGRASKGLYFGKTVKGFSFT